MKPETLFLKFAVVLLGVPVLALCIFLVPELSDVAGELLPAFGLINELVAIIFWASAIPFYFALFQAFKLLRYIDSNDAFSELSVKALRTIKRCAIVISSLHVLVLPLFYLFAEIDDAPGVIFVGLIVPFASMVIAIFAAVLQKLLKNAIDIKSENDLTI
jgi:cellulose synthase/poly-beta-1,6-N-acetylglucosamine synthase-like glycosyltransferase